ncbi:MAG: geranylgeranyl reductase family protein [Fibrobacterota bacterium]
MKQDFDVIIAGAGPAGSSAALYLAKNNANVLLLDKAAFPRYKPCGGGVTARAQALLPPGILETAGLPSCTACMSFLDAGLLFRVERPAPILCLVDRDRFDAALTNTAVASGATFLSGTPVTAVSQSADAVRVMTPYQSFSARYLIAADGVHSPVARMAGWKDDRFLAPAVENEARLKGPLPPSLAQGPRFDFGMVPGGYAWCFPKEDGRLSFGAMTRRRGVFLPRCVDAYMERLGIPSIALGGRTQTGHPIPVSPRCNGFMKGRVLLCGDAAGFTDPVTAEGIGNALLSGRLAADAVLLNAGSPAEVKRGYDAGLEPVLRELRTAKWLARALYGWPRVMHGLFRRHGQALCEAVTDVGAGVRSYCGEVGKVANYLRVF